VLAPESEGANAAILRSPSEFHGNRYHNFSADPAMRRSLEQLLREDTSFSIVGVVDDPAAISLLIDQNHVNVVLADVPPLERLAQWLEPDPGKQPSNDTWRKLMRCLTRQFASGQLIISKSIGANSSDPRAMLPAASNDANSTQMISLRSR
jgi:DNA-binding NarL/FixJ family response regulator